MLLNPIRVFGLIAAAALAGCFDSTSSNSTTTTPTPVATSVAPVAKGCYNLKAVSTAAFAVTDDDAYRASGVTANAAEPFFLQAATLGHYLFYASDRRLLTARDAGAPVSAAGEPTDAAIWILSPVAGDGDIYHIVSSTTDERLAVASDGALITTTQDSDSTLFEFWTSPGSCTAYPEMPLSMTGETYKGRGVDKPIIGFADVHTHMGMSHEMSYDDSVGPSAGGVLYGQPFNRFGVVKALENCEAYHGPNGIRDANNILEMNPTATHDTVGWPTFADWPARNFLTHQVMYYRWVERAWMAGLRVMVNHGTNIQGLCNIGKTYSLTPDADCSDMSVATKQVRYLYQLQDYIDAQSGGRGKGWYRIVKSPMEARQVINDGKLAVILGVEVAQVFGCGVTLRPDGTEVRNCNQAKIDQQIEELWKLGVRHVYPFHDIDSSLGGAGIFQGDVINFLNFLDTGQFWKTTECRAYPADEPLVREPGEEMTTALPGTGNDPLSQLFFETTGGVLPVYPPGRRCNARTVTDLGEYALRALMKRRMIIDIDHAAYHSKDIMLDIADEQNPSYPMASSHDAHGGLTSDQAVRLLKAGGTIYPYKGSGIKHRDFLKDLRFWRQKAGIDDAAHVLGLGYGADANGFGGHPGPRGGDSEKVMYPFTLFQGEGWGPQFAGFDPLSVGKLTIYESNKSWHIDEVGMAHYGLVADFVEEVRLESGEEGLTALYNSAEAFIQMWERVWNRD